MTLLPAVVSCLSSHPSASVIWLHGLGADGHDFVPVIEQLALPRIRFVLPHAPVRPVSLNHGYPMRAWYDIFGLARDSAQDGPGIRSMAKQIEALIAAEIALGIPSHRIVLAGFSQGGAMALYTACRYAQPLAGVLALSTYLPLSETLQSEQHPANQQLHIWQAHGDDDAIIPISVAENACEILRKAHYPVTWHTYAMPHSVCEAEVDDIRRFLCERLPA